ncbi:exonuclease domain-containing protein [Saccharopolyspora tripterygii]
MTWHNDVLVAFDSETTGVDPETARIVTVTVTRIDVTSRTTDSRTWLVDPGVDIPEQATAVHGITTGQARADGARPDVAIPEVEQALWQAWIKGVPVVVYNAPYDLTLLDRELRRYGGRGLHGIGPVIDPLVIDKSVDRYRKGSRKLADVCAHYGIELAADQAHTSAGDALAAARLAWVVAERHPQQLGCELAELQYLQAEWFADQSARFEQFLRGRKTAENAPVDEIDAIVINRSWPLIPHSAEVPA